MTVRFNIQGSSQDLDLQRALDGLYAITLDDVADTHVAIVLERHAAFLAGLHFLHFILESLQRLRREIRALSPFRPGS